jgi:2-polyprenyl-3-methyl-5-hydroxy-6-metoxy-1,4-benzoquinol methylase
MKSPGFSFFRAAYYRLAFAKSFPLEGVLARLVRKEEVARGKGDVPKNREAWDAQYKANVWGYMSREQSRYAIIAGYVASLKPRGSIMDVGCGEGLLFDWIRPYGYARYLGFDISEVAVSKLASKQDALTIFLQADAETFQPAGLYDLIIFNETLYYFHEPFETLTRYVRSLKPGGLMIVSTYTRSNRALAILRQLKGHLHVLEETQTRQGTKTKSWVCTVLQPKEAAS